MSIIFVCFALTKMDVTSQMAKPFPAPCRTLQKFDLPALSIERTVLYGRPLTRLHTLAAAMKCVIQTKCNNCQLQSTESVRGDPSIDLASIPDLQPRIPIIILSSPIELSRPISLAHYYYIAYYLLYKNPVDDSFLYSSKAVLQSYNNGCIQNFQRSLQH